MSKSFKRRFMQEYASHREDLWEKFSPLHSMNVNDMVLSIFQKKVNIAQYEHPNDFTGTLSVGQRFPILPRRLVSAKLEAKPEASMRSRVTFIRACPVAQPSDGTGMIRGPKHSLIPINKVLADEHREMRFSKI